MEEQEAADLQLNSSVANRMTSSVFIPDDLIGKIFESLPTKSILRFRTTCKSLNNWTKKFSFVNNHHRKMKENPEFLLMCRSLEREMLTLHDLRTQELEEVMHRLPIPDPLVKSLNESNLVRRNAIVGPCKGVVCLLSRGGYTRGGNLTGDERIVLCNPILKDFKHLPLCFFKCSVDCMASILGVGLGDASYGNDFEMKIILIRSVTDQRNEGGLPPYIIVHAYSSRNKSWTELEFNYTKLVPYEAFEGLLFNGHCHWNAWDNSEDSSRVLILCFNMSNNAFSKLKYTDSENGKWKRKLTVLNDQLSLVKHKVIPGGFLAIEIWVMQEYGVDTSWMLKFLMRSSSEISRTLCWVDDSRILMEDLNGVLLCVEPLTNNVKELEIEWEGLNSSVVIYEESLLSLKSL